MIQSLSKTNDRNATQSEDSTKEWTGKNWSQSSHDLAQTVHDGEQGVFVLTTCEGYEFVIVHFQNYVDNVTLHIEYLVETVTC